MTAMLICDGHGQIAVQDMLYDRPQGCEATLYTYSGDGYGLNIDLGTWIIQDALMFGIIPKGYKERRPVTHDLYDFWLQGPRLHSDGVPEWNIRLAQAVGDVRGWSTNILRIYSFGRWVDVNVRAKGWLKTSNLIFLQPKANNKDEPPFRVRLSAILQHSEFANRPLDVVWVSCTV